MKKEDILEINEIPEELVTDQKELKFECPNCGIINQDEVIFICNRCDSKEMIFKDGFYLCPQCFTKKDERFMCNNCDSTEVKLKSKL